MQATINGVTVVGTPQEIAEYQRIIVAEKSTKETYWVQTKPYNPPKWLYCNTKGNQSHETANQKIGG
jgi:hypothetical protein